MDTQIMSTDNLDLAYNFPESKTGKTFDEQIIFGANKQMVDSHSSTQLTRIT